MTSRDGRMVRIVADVDPLGLSRSLTSLRECGWMATAADLQCGLDDAGKFVVLDPDLDEDVERLARAIWSASPPGEVALIRAAEILNRLANPTPPKPAEPTEFGARVRDREGALWVRFDGPKVGGSVCVWRNQSGYLRTWSELDIPADGIES